MSRRTLEQELIQLPCFSSMYIFGGNLSSLVDLDDWAKFRDISKKEKKSTRLSSRLSSRISSDDIITLEERDRALGSLEEWRVSTSSD